MRGDCIGSYGDWYSFRGHLLGHENDECIRTCVLYSPEEMTLEQIGLAINTNAFSSHVYRLLST